MFCFSFFFFNQEHLNTFFLQVYIRRSVHEKVNDEINSREKGGKSDLFDGNRIPIVRKSKLLIVDLAGSERIDKSGLSLMVLSKVSSFWLFPTLGFDI